MAPFPDNVIDFYIPESYKGKTIPEVGIRCPENAYGILVDSELDTEYEGCVIIIYDRKQILLTTESSRNEYELRNLLSQYLTPNKEIN